MTAPRKLTAPELERLATNGLLDEMLQLRTFPDPSVLLAAASAESPVDAVQLAWTGAIDAALDLLVPAMKQIAMLPRGNTSGPQSVDGVGIDRIIGRIPMTRNNRGWSI